MHSYGEESLSTRYGTEKPVETLQGEETVKEAMISSDISTEWTSQIRKLSFQHVI